MRPFRHLAPPLRLFQGEDCLKNLPVELDRVSSRRAVVVCGRSVSANTAAIRLLSESMGERCVFIFDGVRAHSPLEAVEAAAEVLRRFEADSVVAIGGGSSIVTARAASILLAEARNASELCLRRDEDGHLVSPKLMQSKLPQMVVLTTPTTSAVKAGSAVFDARSRRRLAMFDPKTRAQAVFIHPVFALSAPATLHLSASLNTLSMAVEGLENSAGNPLSDGMLMHSLRLLARNLPWLARRPFDSALRSELMLAAILCGQGTDHAGGGVASVLAHAIGARYDLDNGIIGAILLPYTMRFNAQATGDRVGNIAEALGATSNQFEVAVDAIERLLGGVLQARRLRDTGMSCNDFNSIADQAFGDWFLQGNPRQVTSAVALLEILRAAW